MVTIKNRPNSDRCLVASCIFMVILLSGINSYGMESGGSAQKTSDSREEVPAPENLVDVHLRTNPHAVHKERRVNWSWRFAISGERFYPNSYISPQNQASYQDMFGDNQGYLATATIGGQYSLNFGAIFLDLQYGGGTISGLATTEAKMQLNKHGLNFGILLDRFSDDPLLSPFIAFQAVRFNWQESSVIGALEGETSVATGLMVGFSFHLNRSDRHSASRAYMEYGLNNTYFDLFAVQYNDSDNNLDPSFKTTADVGLGLRLEF